MQAINPDKPVLVAGASGFVGSHTVQALVAQGRRVRVLLRKSSSRKAIAHLPVEVFTDDHRVVVAHGIGQCVVAFVADDPAAHAGFFATLFDGEITPVPCGITITCGTGQRVEICPPERLVRKGWDDSARPPGSVQAAGVLIRAPGREGLIVPPAEAGGAFIQFTA